MSYSFGRQLGEGIDGTVRLCTDLSSGLAFACKSICKSNSDAVGHIRTEINVLQKLKGHSNIISLHDYFEDDGYIHLIMEICEGGDLCEHLQQKGRLSEQEASLALTAIANAVMSCHQKGIMHRDLKPDNILLPYRNCSYMDLKLADFGTAANFSHSRLFDELEGTPLYLAPEVLDGSYDEKVDIWSMGVLLHIMLCGFPPFNGESVTNIFQSIRKDKLDLKQDPWPRISAEAKDLVRRMLNRNPYRRIKLRELFAHPWMQRFSVTGDESRATLQALNSVVVAG